MSEEIFLCYAREDEEFALLLAEHLQKNGAKIWADQWDIQGGENWERITEDALRNCNHFLIIWSPDAARSEEVRAELRTALDMKKKVVPILYKPSELPLRLRPIQFIDYVSTKPDDKSKLEQLLTILLGDYEPPGPQPQTHSPSRRNVLVFEKGSDPVSC